MRAPSLARQTFSALRHPNFRLWFAGQLVSLFGSFMQMTAQGFLIYQLTHSTVYLGLAGFAGGVPTWFLTLYGGVVADRVDRRRLLIAAQSAMMMLAFVLAGLTYSGRVEPWHILALAAALGVCNAFDAPARQTFILEMIERDDLMNAIALNAGMYNLATIFGPAAGGIVYALYGPTTCFVANGVSFLAVIASLALMNLKPHEARREPAAPGAELAESFRYVLHEPIVRTLILLVAVTTLFGLSFTTLMPAWAVTILGGDAMTNGYLQSAFGFGALCGSVAVAALGRRGIKGRMLSVGTLALPVFTIAFSLARALPMALAFLAAMGVSIIWALNLANATVQSLVPDALRGRVMGLYSLVLFGSMPLGALWVGVAARRLSEPAPLWIGSAVCLVFALALIRKRTIWNIA